MSQPARRTTTELMQTGAILAQTSGFLTVTCGTASSVGYQFIAALSDGMTDTGAGSLPCENGGSPGVPPCGGPIATGCNVNPQ